MALIPVEVTSCWQNGETIAFGHENSYFRLEDRINSINTKNIVIEYVGIFKKNHNLYFFEGSNLTSTFLELSLKFLY